MKSGLAWAMVLLLIVVSAVGLFNWWTEAQHDKPFYEYVQDEWGWFGGSEDTTEEDVVIEDESGEVEATASIKF